MSKLPKSSTTDIKPVQQFWQSLADFEAESLRGGEDRLASNGGVIWGVRSAGGVENPVGWIRTRGTAIAGEKFPLG